MEISLTRLHLPRVCFEYVFYVISSAMWCAMGDTDVDIMIPLPT